MSHYARINGITMKVDKVIVAEHDFIKTLPDYDFWVKTSYNIHGGVYYDPATGQPAEDQSIIISDEARKRKNFASIGFTYDQNQDAFIPPQPFASWTLNEETCLWQAPVAYPSDDKRYQWDEETLTWVEEKS